MSWLLKAVHPYVMRFSDACEPGSVWEWIENKILVALHRRGWYWSDKGWWRAS